MSSDFDILDVLTRHAVNVHGHIRATEDVDVIWLRSGESEGALLAGLNEIEAKYFGSTLNPDTGLEVTYPITESFIRANHFMALWTKSGFLDVFDFIPGEPSEPLNQLFESAIWASGYRFASLEWLRRMKQKAGRDKDLMDLKNLPQA